MFNNPVLDVVIGLVFIYLLYSLLATIIQEIIATKLAFRSKVLEKAIIRMLEDGNSTSSTKLVDRLRGFAQMLGKPNRLKKCKVAAWFYAHPLIKYLGEDNFYSKPAYLSASNFSKVIVDLLRGSGDTINEIQKINDSISTGTVCHLPINLNSDKNNPAIKALRLQLQDSTKDNNQNLAVLASGITAINEDTRLFLQTLWKESEADISKFRQKLEQWFDDTMERTTGWYKRYTSFILFVVGLIIAVTFNVDTISIVRKLRNDPKAREQLVQSANNYIEKNKQLYDSQGHIPAGLIATSDSLKKNSDSLMARADRLFKQDIEGVNNIMGLGWKERKEDTIRKKDIGTVRQGDTYTVRKGHTGTFCGINFHGFLCQACNPDFTGLSILGWFLTALALSLGAPFWFDLLNKLMKLRGSGGKIDSGNTSSASTAGSTTTPAIVNVNTQTSEEAVG